MESEESDRIVRLNVGGMLFATTRDTLCKGEGSMLAAMFSGKYHIEKDEEGRYFIDRDGTHFWYILNYLRDGNAFIPFSNKTVVDELYQEALFYQIESLIQLLEDDKDHR